MPEQIDMPLHVRSHLETKMVRQKICGFRVKELLGVGNTAVTYEVEDGTGALWALKLVTRESYGDHAPLREVARFAQVRDDRFLVFPKKIGDWSIKLKGRKFEFIWFLSRCVRGQTLKKYLESGVQFNARTEVQKCVLHVAVALEELARMGFAHGDMHGRNVMREVIGEDGALPEVRYVIIDFSEAHAVSEAQGGLQKDMECFGHHLQAFADAIYRRNDVSREDHKVLSAIEHIPGLLSGVTAEGIGIKSPLEVVKRLQDGLRAAEESPKTLSTPFDALSAEDIKNDELLIDLCYTKSSWAVELEKPGNVLLIGPRGCGKSMLFRRLRLKTKIAAKKEDELRNDEFVAFHLPCESLFFNRFADLTDTIVEKNRDALIVFFNMAVTMEVASTIAALPEYLRPVGPRSAESFRALVVEEVSPLWDKLNLAKAGASLYDVADAAERIMRHIRRCIAFGEDMRIHAATDYVTRLVEAVKREVPTLAERRFIFFLDDYTKDRVPFALQKSLHPIVCQRSPEVCFKIAAHMFGSIYNFPQQLAADQGRNIRIINLGAEYLDINRKKAETEALIQIMNGRFDRCDAFRGTTIQGWLGDMSFPGGKSLNHALHDKETRSRVKYHGIWCLVELCTGDVSEMIRMVGAIFHEAKVESGKQIHAIDKAVQDRAIRSISRDFLARIRNIRPDGQKLYEIVDNFGKLSRKLLYERPLVKQGKDTKGRERKDPYDLLTIYVDNLPKALNFANRYWELLQMASIFVDIKVAPSQRSVIADRATLRRIYCPAFGTTLTSSEHLQMSKRDFEMFMEKPAEFCERYIRRNLQNDQQTTLWDKTSEHEAVPIEEEQPPALLPDESHKKDFIAIAPAKLKEAAKSLPPLQELESVVAPRSSYDLFIGAMGFEERTAEGAIALVRRGVTVRKALLLEFDLYQEATEERRNAYEGSLRGLTGGLAYRPVDAPVERPDPELPKRLKLAVGATLGSGCPKVIFDCTSCPSRVISKCLSFLFEVPCDLTILYSEAARYYPTKKEWESGTLKPRGQKVEGPFSGVSFVEKPPSLQTDDIGELPVLLVLFPTFNTERTSGVLADVDPAKRVWLIGKPYDPKSVYRVDMAKAFAAPEMEPGDPWGLVNSFDYRRTLEALGGIYAENREKYRITVMPHGTKMQTLGVNLFALAHQVSMVFAMPKNYDPEHYSEGCRKVWAIPLGNTQALKESLRTGRVAGTGGH